MVILWLSDIEGGKCFIVSCVYGVTWWLNENFYTKGVITGAFPRENNI